MSVPGIQNTSGAVPFAISVPGGATAPGDAWRRLGNRIRSQGPGAPTGYAEAQGVRVLREGGRGREQDGFHETSSTVFSVLRAGQGSTVHPCPVVSDRHRADGHAFGPERQVRADPFSR